MDMDRAEAMFDQDSLGGVNDVSLELIAEDWDDYRERVGRSIERMGDPIYEYDVEGQREAFLDHLRSFLDDKNLYSIDIHTPTDENGRTRYEAWILYGEQDG
ncbi:MAG: hypothetical protein ABEJ66_03505 [Candidatus Nanohaloarchaea archaeon]